MIVYKATNMITGKFYIGATTTITRPYLDDANGNPILTTGQLDAAITENNKKVLVTKGAINLTRALEMYEGFDIFSMGHIHENMSRNDVREYLETNNGRNKIIKRTIHHCITGTYKEEYEDGFMGWHVERGAPAKPLGGRILKLSGRDVSTKDFRGIIKSVDSSAFPI
jgi:hypothetical protein